MHVAHWGRQTVKLISQGGVSIPRRTSYTFVAALLLFMPLFNLILNTQALADTPSWLSSNDPTLTQLEPPFSSLSQIPEPTVGSAYNIDCAKMSFMLDSTRWVQGCLVPTAYGALEGNSLLLNGTNLQAAYTGTGTTDGIPSTGSAVRYMSAPSGAYVYIYTNVHSEISTSSLGGGAEGFAYNGAADLKVKDGASNLLAANTSSVTYSRNSQWMVYDSPNKAIIEVNLQTMQVIPFMASQWSVGGPLPMAVSDDGRYIAVSFGNPTDLRVYDISTCSTSIPVYITAPVSCSYRDYASYLSAHLPGFKWATQLRFDSDQNLDFYAQYNYVSGSQYSVAKERLLEPNVSPVIGGYLAMGDSFASGEGAYAYARGTDEATNMCHLSTAAASYIMANTLQISNFHSVACSGAVTPNMYGAQYGIAPADNSLGSWLPGLDVKGQIGEISAASPSVITLSMGGNDIGFKDILTKCTLEPGDCYSHYEDRYELAQNINTWYRQWLKLYSNIRNYAPAGAKIYVTGYPSIIANSGVCGPDVYTTSLNNRQFANYLLEYLNYVIKQATKAAGVQYVDIENALDGHRLCETTGPDTAVNGFTLRSDQGGFGPIGSESFHPSANGQELIANAILTATGNLTQTMPSASNINAPSMTDTDTQLQNLLNAPMSGRAINAVINDFTSTGGHSDAPPIAYVTNALQFLVQGDLDGLKALTNYTVTMNSNPVTIGTLTSDANGNLSGSLTVPNAVSPGFHRVDIVGPNMTGQNVDVQSMVYVAFSSSDYDGDGIPNSSDTCPYTPNSGIDANQDGIDDACEGYVGIPPLYRAVNGDPSLGQDPNLIYVERNQAEAATLGITDYNPSNADWVVVGQTTMADDASSSIANFTTTDLGFSTPNNYSRYVPYLSTRTVDNGCVELTPASLAPTTETSTTTMSLVATNTSTCRSQSPASDVDGDSIPDNQDALYRARNGNAALGEDPNAIYIERNTTAAEAQLGISDYAPNGSAWSLVGLTDASTDGAFNSIGILDPSTDAVLSTSGTITTDMWNTMTPAQLQQLVPVVLELINGDCYAIEPTEVSVVAEGATRTVMSIPVPAGMSCSE